MNKTCYIINLYFGERRCEFEEMQNDRLFFLKKQLEYLEKYKHSLSTIVFGINIEPEHYNYVNQALLLIPKYIQGANVEIVLRKNIGMSYGTWSDIIDKNRNLYEYYILNEDDYFFVQNNWDAYLINKFNSYDDCGYFCMAVAEPIKEQHYKKHASHASGITSWKVLEQIYNKYGKLPYCDNNDYNGNEQIGQIGQTNLYVQLGFNIYDIRKDYRLAFAMGPHSAFDIWRLFWWNENDLILPARLVINPEYMWWGSTDLQYSKEHIFTTAEQALFCYTNKKEFDMIL
jgi:hypothetical protein